MSQLHIGTYLQMGDDFDSRNRFLRNRADGVYEGCIVAGETWSVRVVPSGSEMRMYLRFSMNGLSLDFDPDPGTNSRAVSGTATRVGSE